MTRLPSILTAAATFFLAAILAPGSTRADGPGLEKQIGQMLMIGFPGTTADQPWPAHVARLIKHGKIGGVLLFERNVTSPRQLKRLTGAFKSASPHLLPLIAIDQEGGRVQRLNEKNGFQTTPSARELAGRNDPSAALESYRKMATQLARAGINVNFGPVVDLAVNPDNYVINRKARAYGANPQVVNRFAGLFVRAHRQAGLMTAAKHFPGHGSSAKDTHKDLADISASWRARELEPFAYMIRQARVDMVMVGHLVHKRLTGATGLPASLSPRAIQHHLRKKLGFSGLVVSDDMEMKAITRYFGFEDAVVRAVAAGTDILVISNAAHPDKAIAARAIKAISLAVLTGRIPRARIDGAYARIMAAKRRLAGQAARNRRAARFARVSAPVQSHD
jgi:beta-N-acetylhexosaminidase